MSFDIKIEQGDLKLGSGGDFERVLNEDKLTQDMLKAMFTPTGSHSLHPWYGSPLLDNTVGKIHDPDLMETIIKNGVLYALTNLMTLQEAQEADGQYITPREALRSIDEVLAFLDEQDPRKLNVIVSVTTRLGTRSEESFTINL